MFLKGGSYYLNGRGDRFGPMDELASGVWLDQYGTWYAPDGRQMNHVEGSTGNLVKEICPWCWKDADIHICTKPTEPAGRNG